ncbi:hypothetical protein FW774_03585 (plasmid) [Pedobacter sp. BS3]|uniref:hypothetical protein n=1 Tax=Pedobacter sp. BS3 TaxID=2567937 RepID=UPI0011EF6AFA|nr:hypothetical protein [Pedobacter sp. BS3]TZF86144.1 hypothetical protein FW774_03585 [Pedobacter sp. BS3]
MKKMPKQLLTSAVFLLICLSSKAQIHINGRNPSRSFWGGPQNAVSLSFGNIIWVDGKNVALPGYSEPLKAAHTFGDFFSLERYNYSSGVKVGYDRKLSDKFSLRTAFLIARLVTGLVSRTDLITNDKSRIAQLSVLASYLLTKNTDHRLQFQWLLGPEFLYANKNVTVSQYMVNDDDTPENYNQKIAIGEVGIVTGLGISFRITEKFALFSEGTMGISLPGKGFKWSNSGIGLKYNW